TAIAGLGTLYLAFGWLTTLLSFGALISYAFIYTPLKPVTPFAVFIGAFPGAIPPLLGWVAAANSFGLGGGILFIVQFVWQFPHFWAIAWVLEDDYKLGGLKLLPSAGGRDTSSAFQIYMYSLFLIPTGFLTWAFGFTGIWGSVIAALAAFPIAYYSAKLYRSQSVKDARKVMFSSFFYLPVALIALVLDKL
ncbi:MAG: protoheme IX farnesyltransferase, partial [Luteibaculum sp.]